MTKGENMKNIIKLESIGTDLKDREVIEEYLETTK